jgi:hypothetical protein
LSQAAAEYIPENLVYFVQSIGLSGKNPGKHDAHYPKTAKNSHQTAKKTRHRATGGQGTRQVFHFSFFASEKKNLRFSMSLQPPFPTIPANRRAD